jgi:outer membrane protein assembly factor BamA
VISGPFIAVILTAGAVAVFTPLAAQQNSQPQSSTQSRPATLVRRLAFKCFDANETTNCAQIEQRLTEEGHLGFIDQPYDQTKIDAAMAEIRDFYQEKGVAVNVESDTKPARTGHAVLLTIQINKARKDGE